MSDLSAELPTAPRIAVTGPNGFIAWHLRCAARARWGGDLIGLDREDFCDVDRLAKKLVDVDVVVHLAGVNRAASESAVREENPWLARQLVTALKRGGSSSAIIYGNSVHANGDSAFGVAKREAAGILNQWGAESGNPVIDLVLPNIFGEHGRPHYNSVVATFAHLIARGESPTLVDDKELPLLHVQRACARILDLAESPKSGRIEVPGQPKLVSQVLRNLTQMAGDYRTGDLPNLGDSFTRDLFNTYRAATFPDQFPVYPELRSDQRGDLAEAVRAKGGEAQVFYSSTRPGFTRGQHYHLHKVERFLVLSGQADIRLRRLFSDEVVTFPVTGDRPAIIDMPTMWVHSITNTGSDDLVTLFYADEVLDPASPDTYPEDV